MGYSSAGTPFSPDALGERLDALTSDLSPARWLVAYSGGVDSTVLLHALVQSSPPQPIVAVHVDHGLHRDSGAWADHCETVAASLGIEFIGRRIVVPERTDTGPEAAARQARYAAFLSIVDTDDCLLSAHHEKDQAETLLLNLLRGSGPAGLAGIGARQAFGRGYLLRPLIGVEGDALVDYARTHHLEWIDDPSNEDTRFDRNFLRRDIIPRLAERWPAVANRLRRSADLMGEASELLNDLAAIDLGETANPGELALDTLRDLPAPRRRNALRYAVRRCGLPPPPSTALIRMTDELIPARADARPLVTWAGAEARRYRDVLYLQAALGESPPVPGDRLFADGPAISLGDGLGQLSLVAADGAGIDPDLAAEGLHIRFRRGGESLRLSERGRTQKLKKLMQDDGILPWMRDRLPLLYCDDRLVAVADLWIEADCRKDRGLRVRWSGKPAIRPSAAL